MSPAAQRDFRKLPLTAQRRLEHSIMALSETPRPSGSRKLSGDRMAWRIRVDPFRAVYDIDDATSSISVLKVARRNEATYRR